MRGGGVKCWGWNEGGNLGDGKYASLEGPVALLKEDGTPLRNVIQISAGSWHGSAVTEDGRAWTWGQNYDSALGIAKDLFKLLKDSSGDGSYTKAKFYRLPVFSLSFFCSSGEVGGDTFPLEDVIQIASGSSDHTCVL